MNGQPAESQSATVECIRIRGARTHNLRNVDLDIPRDRFVVVTGPSGSGKSSLAFDTLYAEGQRQYIESLSIHARQFLRQLERPDVRSDRRPPADDLRRSAPGRPQPAKHRGDRHRGVRLPAAALRAAGRGELLPLRRGDPPAVAGRNTGLDPRPPRGDANHGLGPDRPRPQGPAPRCLRAHAQGGVPAGEGGRRRGRRQRTARTHAAKGPFDRGGDRPRRRPRGHPGAIGRIDQPRRPPRRRAGDGQPRGEKGRTGRLAR